MSQRRRGQRRMSPKRRGIWRMSQMRRNRVKLESSIAYLVLREQLSSVSQTHAHHVLARELGAPGCRGQGIHRRRRLLLLVGVWGRRSCRNWLCWIKLGWAWRGRDTVVLGHWINLAKKEIQGTHTNTHTHEARLCWKLKPLPLLLMPQN